MDTSNSGDSRPPKPVFKRKKKPSLVQQVKKKFKKGNLASEDSSSGVDDNLYQYFLRVFELHRKFEGTQEEKSVFANNALVQTEKREVNLSYNQLVSRVVENLLPLASNEVLERYFDAFGINLRPICVHEFASHVLQTLMVISSKRAFTAEETEEDVKNESHKAICRTWLLKASKFLLNNIEEFMWDWYTNPTLRTAMLCLAGLPQLDKHSHTKKSEDNTSETPDELYKTTDECLEVLEEFYKGIAGWPQFKDLIDNPLSSGFLQTLLTALKHTNKKIHKKLCHKLLADCFSNSSVVISSPSALFVLEVMVEQSNPKFRRKIYDQFLSKRLLEMACSRVGNMTLQKIINNCCSAETVSEILTVLAPNFTAILSARNGAVLASLCEACARLNTSQSQFFQSLTKCLGLDNLEDSQKQLVPAILSLTPLSQETQAPETKAGSQILQSLLKFKKNILVVNSLLTYESKALADLLSSIHGSFVTKAFCESKFIGEKRKLKLIQRLMGHYSYLAKSKFGSRTFDDIWLVADMNSKKMIVQNMVSNFSEVKASKFGQFVASKVRLELFYYQGEEAWSKKVQNMQSTTKLFKNIIGDLK